MSKSTDVTAGNQAFASEYNDLRNDALRLLLNKKGTVVTIASGVASVDPNKGYFPLAAESGTEDNLDTMTASSGSFADGDIIFIQADTGDRITIRHNQTGPGEFQLPHGEDLAIEGDTILGFVYDLTNTQWELLFSGGLSPAVGIIVPMGGLGAAMKSGEYKQIRWRYDFVLQAVSLMADQSGTVSVQFWHDTWANYPPTVSDLIGTVSLSSAQKGEDTSLSGFTKKVFLKGEVTRLYVPSDATSIEQLDVELRGMRIE